MILTMNCAVSTKTVCPKKTISLLLCLCICLCFSACKPNSSSTPAADKGKTSTTTAPKATKTVKLNVFQLLDADAFEEKQNKLENELVIDLRTQGEIDETGYITGAQKIDFRAKDFKTKIAALDKKQPILLYCASGGRSGKTAKMLRSMDFEEVYDLDGGMGNWLAKGKTITTDR